MSPTQTLFGLPTVSRVTSVIAAGYAPEELVGTTPAPGYSVTEGTGYAPSGYVFAQYRVQGTGTGPRNTEREVEVQVQVGPVAQ